MEGGLKGGPVHALQQQGVLVKHVGGLRRTNRNFQPFVSREGCVVRGRHRLATGCKIPQMRQFHAQNGRLKRVQTGINPYGIVVVLDLLTVVGHLLQERRKVVVLGEQGAAVAKATQILGREKRRAADVPHRSGLGRVAVREGVGSPNGLGSIFHHKEVKALRNAQ